MNEPLGVLVQRLSHTICDLGAATAANDDVQKVLVEMLRLNDKLYPLLDLEIIDPEAAVQTLKELEELSRANDR